ncbi:MAG TPA: phosphatidylserine/phosphatidylglycerophosphate/cardiolipin synthase family protein [Candidatus Paceibacterota bacterium]|jgi:cardiolipin synthase|nr:phosphatidylserine/phosphatidylglycerophosphate/cardiolipin synthase family protein [Candidatus Paceibacterota bacterium]
MRYKIYTKTEKAWDAMLTAISRAKSSILFEMYTFVDNTADSHDFIEILRQKASAGVSIKIIIDSFGSSEFTDSSLKKLKDAGAEIFIFRELFRHTHRKILVIDERVAYIGGINITKFYKKWDDLQIKIEGKVVKYAIRSFVRAYKYYGGKDPLVLKYDKDLRASKGKVSFFEHSPLRDAFRLSEYYSDKIEFAKEKILIVTPYFMANHWLIKGLKKAAKRGVKVEIIMPRIADHPKIANIPNYFYMHKLHKHDITFFLTREMLHSKMMLIDGREGILGSQNIDILSFNLNAESGIFFTDLNLISELDHIAEAWKKDSIVYSPKMRSTHVFDHFLQFCFSAFEHAVKLFNKLTA